MFNCSRCSTILTNISRYPDDKEDASSVPSSSVAVYTTIGLLALCGLLAAVTNGAVLLVGITSKKRIFQLPVLSLAFLDLTTGLVCIPLIILIYYLSM